MKWPTLELTCACGRPIPTDDQVALFGRRPCPDCGSRTRKWSRTKPWWRRLFSRHEWPRWVAGRGPRYLAVDYGFNPAELTAFTQDAVGNLHLVRRKNRWRFRQI